jgi:Resolvase, N terminal domain
MGHVLGYARVSTADQQPHLQVEALEHAGCYRMFVETASGARTTGLPSSRSWTSSAPATRWSSGSWTGSAARFATLSMTWSGAEGI